MSSGFIQELIRENAISMWLDFRAGHTDDLSQNNSNNGVIHGNCIWEGFGLRFVDNTAYVEVAHGASLNVTDATMVLLKPKMRSHRLSSGTANAGGIGKRDGGAGTIWYSPFTVNLLTLNDGTVTRWPPTLYDDDERYAAFSLAAGGGTAIGYREGLSAGNFNGANTLPTNTHNVRIGRMSAANYYVGTIQSVMLINRVLTAAEHAQLYDELANLTWPTGLRGFAKRSQLVEKADSKLISGWNLKPIGGQVPDEITTRDLTTINRMVSKPGILGPGMSGPVEGYLATANDPYVNADFSTNGLSVECWLRPAALPGGNNYFFDYAGRIRMRQNGAVVLWEVYDSAAAYQTASGPLRVNELMHIVGTAKANGDVKLYLDEELQAATDTMLNFNIFAGRPAVWGAGWNFLLGIDADFFKPRIYDYELSQAEVSAKYLEGARAIQFKTDWGFQVSPAAEGGVLHQQIGTRSSPFRAGDAVGRWKIETDTVDGQLCKVVTCTTAGLIYVPASLFFDTTSTESAFGTWDFWAYKADASTFDMNLISNLSAGITTGYGFTWDAAEAVVVIEYGVGNVVAGGTASHSVWHQFRLTRSSAGLFTPYIDGVGFGVPAADLTTTTSDYMLFDMDAGDKLALGSLEGEYLIKMLGVVAP